jgi:hypothetical protein
MEGRNSAKIENGYVNDYVQEENYSEDLEDDGY